MRGWTILTTLGLCLAACGGDEVSGTFEDEEGRQGSYTVDRDGQRTDMKIRTEEGDIDIRSGPEVTAELPEGFSLYPGARIVNSTVMRGDASGQEGAMLVFTSSASPEKLISYYRDQAEDAGIEIQMETTAGGSRMIGGEGPDGLSFSFSANEAGDETTGTLLIGREG
ncbi:MAG: hypothetical protein ACFBQW_09060 [Sphingomonadaceae bacterium]